MAALKAISVPVMLQTLETGTMQTVAAGLTSSERLAVTFYLAIPTPKESPTPPASAMCSREAQKSAQSPQWGGWSTDDTNARFQDAKAAGLTHAKGPKLKLKWSFGLGGGTDARSQPAIADGRMYFGTTEGSVYSLDARSGCIHWTFRADRDVRSAIVIGDGTGPVKRALYFGAGATAYALNAADGKPAVEGPRRGSSRRQNHRRSAAAQGRLVHARRIDRRGFGTLAIPAQMLHVARQRGRARRRVREGALEDLDHRRNAEADQKEQDRRPDVWTFGSRRVVHSDVR